MVIIKFFFFSSHGKPKRFEQEVNLSPSRGLRLNPDTFFSVIINLSMYFFVFWKVKTIMQIMCFAFEAKVSAKIIVVLVSPAMTISAYS